MMLRTVVLIATLCLPAKAVALQVVRGDGPVLLEVPLMVQAPGFHAVVRAYHDGERFFVDAAPFFERLGYTVERHGLQLQAADTGRQLALDFARMRATRTGAAPVPLHGNAIFSEGRYLVAVQSLQHLFGSDVFFDESRLSLQLSTVAESFDTFALGPRAYAGSEVPGPLRFGRRRHILGGVTASWHVSRQWRRGMPSPVEGDVQFATSMLGGSVRGTLGRTPEATYLFDRPGRAHLTRVEIGRMAPDGTKPLDAIRLSNMPLAALHRQRTETLKGRAAPHAMVEAVIGGQVVDRARVGQGGHYRLRVPAYYGSTEALVRVHPLGGAPAYQERHYVLATPSLVPPRRLYYDAVIADGGALHVRYGIGPRLTARMAARQRGAVHIGIAASPVPYVVLAAEIARPLKLAQASAHLWRRHISAETVFTNVRGDMQGHFAIRGQWRQLGAQVSGFMSRMRGGWTARRFMPSVSWHGRSGFAARLQVQAARYGGLGRTHWHATAGRAFTLRAGGMHFGAFVRGARALHSGGLEVLFSTRHLSVDLAIAYDPVTRQVSGQATLQLRTGALGFASRMATGGAHRHSAYGSISVGPGIRLARAMRDETAALLRLFEDRNGNGALDPGELLMPDVEVQLFHAPLRRTPSGALRAMYLQPYAAYQVRILEQSIRDPWLRPQTGYAFSFIADPGRTKVLDIPLQRVPLVRGRVHAFERPNARLRVRALARGALVATAPVYRDGGFALRLPPGRYVLQLDDGVDGTMLQQQPLSVPAGARILDVAFAKE